MRRSWRGRVGRCEAGVQRIVFVDGRSDAGTGTGLGLQLQVGTVDDDRQLGPESVR